MTTVFDLIELLKQLPPEATVDQDCDLGSIEVRMHDDNLKYGIYLGDININECKFNKGQ